MDFDVLIPLSLFASIFGIAYMFFKTRNSERLAMIEKGLDVSVFKQKDQKSKMTLKIGMLFIGVALGVILGSLIDIYTVLDEQAYIGMVFIMGGSALVLNDFIEKKREKKA